MKLHSDDTIQASRFSQKNPTVLCSNLIPGARSGKGIFCLIKGQSSAILASCFQPASNPRIKD